MSVPAVPNSAVCQPSEQWRSVKVIHCEGTLADDLRSACLHDGENGTAIHISWNTKPWYVLHVANKLGVVEGHVMGRKVIWEAGGRSILDASMGAKLRSARVAVIHWVRACPISKEWLPTSVNPFSTLTKGCSANCVLNRFLKKELMWVADVMCSVAVIFIHSASGLEFSSRPWYRLYLLYVRKVIATSAWCFLHSHMGADGDRNHKRDQVIKQYLFAPEKKKKCEMHPYPSHYSAVGSLCVYVVWPSTLCFLAPLQPIQVYSIGTKCQRFLPIIFPVLISSWCYHNMTGFQVES